MEKKTVLALLVIATALSLVLVPAATAGRLVESDGASAIAARRTLGEFEWHAGDSFLKAINPTFSPAVARADNGDTIAINATGTLSLMPKTATGGGRFVHKDAQGTVVAEGDLHVMGLIMFRSYGNGTPQGLPATFIGGFALLRVHVQPDAGGPGFMAILWVDCELGKVPRGHHEGVRLVVQDVINFNKQVSGATLFIRL